MRLQRVFIYIGDIWDLCDSRNGRYIIVPTNTTTRKDGCAVMGRGIAKQAVNKYKKLAKAYGGRLRKGRTLAGFYVFKKRGLIMLPVKKHWEDNADKNLINNGLLILKEVLSIKKNEIKQIAIPMLGCGFGGLTYEEIFPILFAAAAAMGDKIVLVIPPDKLYENEKYYESFLPAANNKKDRRVSLSNKFSDIEI